MKTFYTLSNAAGLIRSNKFAEKPDAVAVASFRAETRGLPVKIYEHKDHPANKVAILVANPDGSVEKPEGAGYKVVENDHDSAARNSDQAHILLASTDQTKGLTAIYLKSGIGEMQVAELEKASGVEIGLYDDRVLHCYTEDSKHISAIEEKLAEASVEIDRVRKHTVKASAEKTQVVSAARKAHMRARAANLPELSIRSSTRAGRSLKVHCHCELFDGTGQESPTIMVYGDGSKIGTAKSSREASAIMSDYAQSVFSKYLRKELA